MLVPLLSAAALGAVSAWVGRKVVEVVAVAAATATTVLCAWLLVRSGPEPIVYWFAGWRPRRGIALGISFVVDRFGAGLATLVAVLVTVALVFSLRSFMEIEGHRFHVLMLVFLGGMVGFSLTGDLFNLFVFFELMSVASYALTGTEIQTPAPLQGALNLGVMNSIGGFTILWGIGLVYARTGALNLAQIGVALAARPPDGLVITAFTLILAGLLVKASVVPFHFWLPDAHAVAPTPVCLLFSGVMVELALYGAARVYWTAFDGPLAAHAGATSNVLVGFGALTALVGAVMCFAQQHLKRLLAFSTVSHVGLFLVGLGVLDHVSLAGVAIYVLGHGLAKAALFMCVGIVLHRLGSIDEEALRGVGRHLVGTGVMFALGGLALAEMPPFATAIGHVLIEEGAARSGFGWTPWLFGLASAVTGGAVLRATGRVFLGLGPREPDRFASERLGEVVERETEGRPDHTPVAMALPPAVLLAGALALGMLPGFTAGAQRAALAFEDRTGYAERVLEGRRLVGPEAESEAPAPSGLLAGLATGAGAVALAAFALFRKRLLSLALRRRFSATLGRGLYAFRSLQSGHVGDYTAWFVVGLAVLGGLFALSLT